MFRLTTNRRQRPFRYLLALVVIQCHVAMESAEQRNLQQNATMITSAPVAAVVSMPTSQPTTLAPTAAPTAPLDFTQINMLLESATLMLPATTISPEADVDGCGVLGAIDLQIELMVTEQVNEFLVDQELDIPTDLFEFGRRNRKLAAQHNPGHHEMSTLVDQADLLKNRNLKEVCADTGSRSDVSETLSIDNILEMLRFQLELNLDDRIDDILRDLRFDIPTTTIELSDFLQNSTNTAAADAFRDVAMMDSIQNALSISFGEELSEFIQQFEIEVPNQQQQGVNLFSALLDLDVTNVVCRDFGLKELDVTTVFNAEFTTIDSLDVNLDVAGRDITAVCSGDVVFGFIGLRTQGSFEADLRFEEFDLGFRFAGGALSATNCNTALQVDNVDLSGVRILFFDVGDDFINAAFGFIEGFVLNILERFVNPLICNLVNDGINGGFGNNVAGTFSTTAATEASGFEETEGSLTLRKGRCDGLEVNGGFEVSASVKGLSIDADVDANQAAVTCSGQVVLSLFGIEAQAKFSVSGFADELSLGVEFDGADLSFDSCSIVAGIEAVEVDDVRVDRIDVPEDLTDQTVAMVSQFVFELINPRLGGVACDTLEGTSDGFNPFGGDGGGGGGGGGRADEGISAEVELIEGSCRDVTVGDVNVRTKEINEQVLAVDVDVKGVDISCSGTIGFAFAGVSGTLDFSTDAEIDKFLVDLFLVAETRLCEQFPSSGCIDSCKTKLSIDDLQLFDVDAKGVPDSLIGEVLDVLEDPITDIINSLAGDVACSALDGLAPGLIEGFLPATDGTQQTFTVLDTVCSDLSVESLSVSSSQPTDDSVLFPLNLENLGITCNGELDFQLAQLVGSTSFSVNVTATADIVFGFMSQNFSLFPPDATSLDSCDAVLTTNMATISNVAIEGFPDFLLDTLLGFVDGLLDTIIEEQGPSLICGAVNDTSFLTNLITQVSDPVSANLPPREPVDPLTTEASFNASDVLLDFTGAQTSSIDFFASIITGPLLSPAFVVNNILSGLLNNESALVLDGGGLGLGDALRFETDFAVINATLGNIAVFGLDSLSEVGDRVVYGNYTIGSTFKFDQINIVADLDLKLRPINNQSALIGFGGEPILETVQVSWNTTQLAGNFSLFLAIIVEEFAVVPTSALITDTASVLPCLLGSLAGLELPQLEFTLDFVDPIVTGFSSTGTERLARGFIETLFLMYGPSLSLAMPGLAQNLFRPSLNELLAGAIEGEQDCPFAPSEMNSTSSNTTDSR